MVSQRLQVFYPQLGGYHGSLKRALVGQTATRTGTTYRPSKFCFQLLEGGRHFSTNLGVTEPGAPIIRDHGCQRPLRWICSIQRHPGRGKIPHWVLIAFGQLSPTYLLRFKKEVSRSCPGSLDTSSLSYGIILHGLHGSLFNEVLNQHFRSIWPPNALYAPPSRT